MAMVTIGQQRLDVGAERSAGWHSGGRSCPIVALAIAAPVAEQFDPHHHSADLGRIDEVAAVMTPLIGLGHHLPATQAGIRQAALGSVRIIGQRARHSTGTILRRRNVRISQRLSRFLNQRLEFGNLRRQTSHQYRLLDQQRVLPSLT